MSRVLPQHLTSANADVRSVEWLFEPFWPGTRYLVHVTDGEVHLTDARGEAAPAAPDLAPALAAGIRASQAIVDGVWSELGEGPVFVAVDLVQLDGERLDDVPFQERRRLLAAVVEEGEMLRIGPAVKHPVDGWLGGWRAMGFTHYVAKHQNSHYLAGERNEACIKIPIVTGPPARPSMLGRLAGGRERTVRIRD